MMTHTDRRAAGTILHAIVKNLKKRGCTQFHYTDLVGVVADGKQLDELEALDGVRYLVICYGSFTALGGGYYFVKSFDRYDRGDTDWEAWKNHEGVRPAKPAQQTCPSCGLKIAYAQSSCEYCE